VAEKGNKAGGMRIKSATKEGGKEMICGKRFPEKSIYK